MPDTALCDIVVGRSLTRWGGMADVTFLFCDVVVGCSQTMWGGVYDTLVFSTKPLFWVLCHHSRWCATGRSTTIWSGTHDTIFFSSRPHRLGLLLQKFMKKSRIGPRALRSCVEYQWIQDKSKLDNI